ncbi:MAG: F0F1 ATP synthase subunit A, partial [Deltaproteobacteria bacterium]
MEHPYLFFVKLFELLGIGHFAHAYPHVIYSWVVMIILIVLGSVATRSISMIPAGAQNFFEIFISGMEEFMVDVIGEEGRWVFPIIGTVFIYVAECNLIGLIPGFLPPSANLNT